MPWSKEKKNLYQREYRKEYRLKYPEKARADSRKYSHTPKAIAAATVYRKKYYMQHKEKIDLINKEYRSLHPEKGRMYVKIARGRKYNSRGTHTAGEWERLKAQYGYTCPCCYKKEPEITLTEDHIIPLSIGGFNSIQNIQPLCHSCNSKKHTQIRVYPI